MTPPETGRGEGRDASKARFSGQGARGPALCEPIASTEGEAPAGGAFAAPAGWATAEALRRGYGPAWRAGRPGVRCWQNRRGEGDRDVSAGREARAMPHRPQRVERFAEVVSGGVLVPSLGFRNGHLKPCFEPAEPAAGADGPGSLAPLGSPARGTPARRWAAEAFGGESAMCTPGRDRGRCCTRSADPTRGLLLQREGLRDRERGTGWQGEAGHDVGAACGAARNT